MPLPCDPDAATIVSEDIPRFWEAFDRAAFRDLYLRPGSPGLEEWMRARLDADEDRAAALLTRVTATHRRFFESIRANSLAAAERPGVTDSIRDCLHRFKAIYPDAVFPVVHLLMGVLSCGGTTGRVGILIGTEMFGCDRQTCLGELTPWQRANVRSLSTLAHTIVHELVHWHQSPGSRRPTLLERALREGAAVFLSELVSGVSENASRHQYGHAHESELWAQFSQAMNGTDATAWMYQGDSARERPSDLAYFVGYRICATHFGRHGDSRAAVRQLLHWTDAKVFLRESGYTA